MTSFPLTHRVDKENEGMTITKLNLVWFLNAMCSYLFFWLLIISKPAVFLYFKPLLSGFGVGQLRRKCDHRFSCVHYTCLISLMCFMIFDLDLTDREKSRVGMH